ncbi:hypothetical protein [Microvirga arabica]|uniref:Uncharacterized protein n=1 Tax=Microvirga arabica TaxID=1128671 RepID=A0ABV6YA62_9HYPH|nr:hypothetical protein [Microvirga arabica]MBM1172472.1 hypothetical protein [Microvirga arabica]
MIINNLKRRGNKDENRLDHHTRRAIVDLYRVDLRYELDLLKIESSNLDENAKSARKLMILIEHFETRRPYLDLLNERWAIQCYPSRNGTVAVT